MDLQTRFSHIHTIFNELFAMAASSSAKSKLTFEDVATFPRPGMSFPLSFKFTPDDGLVTCLYSPENTLTQQVYSIPSENVFAKVLNLQTELEQKELSLEERLRRERMRTMTSGVSSYAWASGASGVQRLLIPTGGAVHIQEGMEGSLRQITAKGAKAAIDPRFSPDGEMVAFVRESELFVVAADGHSPERQLTFGADPAQGIHNGLAEFVAQEEFSRYFIYFFLGGGGQK